MTKTGHFVIGYKTPLATGFTEVKIYIVSTLKTLFLNRIGQQYMKQIEETLS